MSISQNDDDDSIFASLTVHEKQVVALVVQGYTSKEIAAKLGTAEDVIRHELYCDIFDKFGVSTRLELAYLALHHRADRK
jgi:DNA-binding NarL/FixJ family response regulator